MGSWQGPSATPGPHGRRGPSGSGRWRRRFPPPARDSARGSGGNAGSAPAPRVEAGCRLRGGGSDSRRSRRLPLPTPGSLRPSRPLPWPGRPRLAGAGPVTSPIHTAAQLAPPGRSPRQRGRRSAGNDFQLPARGSAPAAPPPRRAYPLFPSPLFPSPSRATLYPLPKVFFPCPTRWGNAGRPEPPPGAGVSRSLCGLKELHIHTHTHIYIYSS